MSDIFPDNGVTPIAPQYVPVANALATIMRLYNRSGNACPPSLSIDAMNALLEEIGALYDKSGISDVKNGGPILLNTSNWFNLVNSVIYQAYGFAIPSKSQLQAKGINAASGFPTAYYDDTAGTPAFYVWNDTTRTYVVITGGGGGGFTLYHDDTLHGAGTLVDRLGWTGAFTDETMTGSGLVGSPLHAIPLPNLAPFLNTANFNYPINTWLTPYALPGQVANIINQQLYVVAWIDPAYGQRALYYATSLSPAAATGGFVLPGTWMTPSPFTFFGDARPLAVRVA
jgi:hypothetical protein